ncbi:ABC transporter substrate-binding protein [Promicromonospora sukumoe]|uniref:Peptide/nickel transport system substrate-binding protein n=1 Tax=Promicromonospora sukumoe TaxID=88382 RepID=A0A7W3J8Z3_9MICO|nr:ABC transporter substrate-binding protein [Promicromonospora sukumoe]MBA8808478.1 peptide/nickel transport system substrate-binding protein [Promicromonospora sukumoe]
MPFPRAPRLPAARRLAAPVAVAALALTLAACSTGSAASTGGAEPAGDPVAGGSLTWGVSVEPVCYNPQRSGQQNSYPIIRNYAESLVGKAADGSYTPWLAEEWEISDDETVYTFTLRDGVTFSDGTDLTADVVKQNYDAITAEDSTLNSRAAFAAYDNAEATDDHTLVVTLAQPDAAFLDSVASIGASVLAPASLKADGDLCQPTDELVGTGPFTVADWTAGQEISFDKRDDYDWAPGYAEHTGAAYLDDVTYRYLPEATVRTGALTAGQVDVIENVQVTDTTVFQDAPGFQYLTGPTTGTAFSLNINTRIAPADDVRVRQALRDGFDLDALIENQYLGTVERAYSSLGPDSPYFDEDLVGSWGNDVDGANALLDEAGWTDRDDDGYRTKDGERLTIEVGYPEPYVRDERDVLLQAIKSQLKENIGLNLDVQIITGALFSDQTAKGTWTVYPNTLPTADPSNLFRSIFSSEGFLYTAAEADLVLDDEVAASRASLDPASRKEALDEIQATVVDDARYVPLYHPVYTVAAKDTVHGLAFEPQLDSPAGSYDVWVQP